jgi:hypothetical protein
MKKITSFLMMLLTVTFGFAQQEVVQDFEDNETFFFAGFGGLDASIEADPATGGTNGNTLQLVTSESGNVWQGGEIVQEGDGLYFDLSSDITISIDVYATQAFTLMSKLENGEDGAPNSGAAQDYTTPNQWQTLTFTFNDNLDGTAPADGVYAKLVFFPNWDSNTDNFGASPQAFTVNVDNITSEAVAPTPPAQPETAAPTPPARPAEDVFSVYSNAYTNESSDLGAFGGGSLLALDVDGDDFIRLSGAPGANLQWFFGIPDGVDLSSYTHYHIDYFFEGDVPGEGAVFQTIIQGFDSNSEFTGNTLHNITPTETGVWLSLDIPIESFNGGTSVRTNIGQMQLAMAGPAFGPTFVDNIYFHKNTTLSNNDFSQIEFNVYPNPAQSQWTIEAGSNTIDQVQVFDLTGRQVLKVSGNEQSKVQLNASSLNAGVYLAKIQAEGTSKSIKLIKK